MVAYTAKQNKAFHKGAYIQYLDSKYGIWTTNGQIMVRAMIKQEELKPLKDQVDLRGTGLSDVTTALKYMVADMTPLVDQVKEWQNSKGLNLVTGYGMLDGERVEVDVQADYLDYITARFSPDEWYISSSGLFAKSGGQVVAFIAKVIEPIDSKQQVKGKDKAEYGKGVAA